MGKKRRRRTGKIDRLSPELRSNVESMLRAGVTYREIVAFLQENEQMVSQMCVQRFAERYLATVEMLTVAQENFRMLAEEVDKYPGMDTTEVILRVASQQALSAIANTSSEQWENVPPEKLLQNATALVRVAAYKRKTDLAVKTEQEQAIEGNKALLAELLSTKHPALYSEVMAAIKQEQLILEEVDT